MTPIWECDECKLVVLADCPAGDDWPDGVLRGCPARCPECDHVADCVGEGHEEGGYIVEGDGA